MARSRVGNAIPRMNTRETTAFRAQVGATRYGLLGNGNGAVEVKATSNHNGYSLVWAREIESVDASGAAITSEPFRAIAKGSFYPADGMPVNISVNPSSKLMQVEENNVDLAAAMGLNTNGINPQSPARKQIKFSDVINMRGFIPTSNTTSSTDISIQPYIYAYDGTLKLAEKGQSDNVDLSSYVPSAGLERLVGTAIKASDNSVQIVSGSTRTITNGGWALADYQELYALLDSDAMPTDIWWLKDAQSEITMSDRHLDWRQIINVPNQVASGDLTTLYEPLTDGDEANPELIFVGGDVVMIEVAA